MQRFKTIIGRVIASRAVWLAPLVISGIYFIVQCSQISLYGVTWDEPLHRNWGKIFALFWKMGDRRILELMPGHGMYYGPLYFYLNYIASEFLYSHHLLSFVASNHILTLFVSAIAVGLIYVLARSFAGPKAAGYSVLLFLLYPPFIAHAHYNPKDIPLMVAVLFTSLVFIEGLRRDAASLLLCSGFLFGFAVAIKVNALLMAPVFAATYLIWLADRMQTSSARAVLAIQIPILISTLLLSLIGVYLFWPSAWGDWHLILQSIQFFTGENFWPGKVLFFGAEYAGKDLPWYYIPFEYAVSMPLLTLLFFIAGIVVFLKELRKREQRVERLFFLLWILVPLLFSIKPGLVRYDGMRQFFFVLPAIIMVAAVGFSSLVDLLMKQSGKRRAPLVFLGIVLVSLISQLLTVHPFEGSYRSELLQLSYKKNLDRSFQIEYWGPTYKQGMDWLIDNATPNPVICVPTAGILVTWYPWREDFTFECSHASNYVMFFTRYSEARAYEDLKNPVFSIERMNSLLLAIYKVQ